MDSVTLVDSIGPSFGAFLYLWTVNALGYLLEENFIVRYINNIIVLNGSKRLIIILNNYFEDDSCLDRFCGVFSAHF